MPNNSSTVPTNPNDKDAYDKFLLSMAVSGVTDEEIIKEQAKSRGFHVSTMAGNKPGETDVKPSGGVTDTVPFGASQADIAAAAGKTPISGGPGSTAQGVQGQPASTATNAPAAPKA